MLDGDFFTVNYVSLGCGLHSITGLKKPISILAKYEHSGNYNTIQEIETAQAELAQKLISLQYPLPLMPIDQGSKVETIFWWDNFDCKKETKEGSVHICHGIVFQEESSQSAERDKSSEVPRSKKITVSVAPLNLPQRQIFSHKEPAQFQSLCPYEFDDLGACRILLCWKLQRQVNGKEDKQSILRFVGWIDKAVTIHSVNTRVTFLPPIGNPISDYSTVLECIFLSQKLAESSNMKYTHITVDAGAAAEFFHVVWNNPVEFKTVLIHLVIFMVCWSSSLLLGKLCKEVE